MLKKVITIFTHCTVLITAAGTQDISFDFLMYTLKFLLLLSLIRSLDLVCQEKKVDGQQVCKIEYILNGCVLYTLNKRL